MNSMIHTTTQSGIVLNAISEWMNESLFPLKSYNFYKQERTGYMCVKMHMIN